MAKSNTTNKKIAEMGFPSASYTESRAKFNEVQGKLKALGMDEDHSLTVRYVAQVEMMAGQWAAERRNYQSLLASTARTHKIMWAWLGLASACSIGLVIYAMMQR